MLYIFYIHSNYNDLTIESKNEAYNNTGIEYHLDHIENNVLGYVSLIAIFTVIGCVVGSFSNFYLLNLVYPTKDERIVYCPKLQNCYEETGVILRITILIVLIVGTIIAKVLKCDNFIIFCVLLGITAILGVLTSFVQVMEAIIKCILYVVHCKCCRKRSKLQFTELT